MRVVNPSIKNDYAYSPYGQAYFDKKGVSNDISTEAAHYFCKFSGFRPLKGATKPADLPEEPTQKATKQEMLAFCSRHSIGGVSEDMTKAEILGHIHKVLLERQGAGRMAGGSKSLQPGGEPEKPPAEEEPPEESSEEEEEAE
jgi:hypothetical protein